MDLPKDGRGVPVARRAARERDSLAKSQIHYGMQVVGDRLRQRVVDELENDAMRSLGKAVRGTKPFTEPQHWAIRIVFEAGRALGSPIDVDGLVRELLGESVAFAKDAVEARQRIASIASNDEQLAAEAEQFLTEFYRRKGRRLMVVDESREVAS